MVKLIKHFKRWNKWRKNCLNSRAHKFLVLIGIVKSPTFYTVWTDEEEELYYKAVMEAFNSRNEQGNDVAKL